MNRREFLAAGAAAATPAAAEPRRYEADFKSIDQRPIPAWFNEAKFGIFVVWGPYSVPAWVDKGYAEWYGNRMQDKNSPTGKFHLRNYGPDFQYEDFAPLFKAELWDPDAWADLFARSGARYVVTTAKYHDGFCLWPCETARTVRTNRWNSMATGPKRDLLGELNAAGNKRGLKMGIYYSLYEWWHPLWLSDRDRFVTEQLHPNFKEVVTRYKPPVIFLDGEWEMPYPKWRSEELAQWLYNESPVRDEVVVNDRWGQCRSLHGDYYSSEYGGGDYPPWHPWQEDRGIGQSYGYNRNESIADYDSADNLIRMLSKVCGNGGNLLLDVGPTADGRIPVIMQERLLQIGEWLKVNGEAIYGSQASPFWPRRFEWGAATARPGRIYLHVHDRERQRIEIRGVRSPVRRASLLSAGGSRPVEMTQNAGVLRLALPQLSTCASVAVIALEIDGPADVDKTPEQFEDGSVLVHCYGFEVHGSRARIVFSGYDHTVHVGNWTDPTEWVEGRFDLLRPGAYDVQVVYTCDAASAGSAYAVSLNGWEFRGRTGNTGGGSKYRTIKVGRMDLSRAGRYSVEVRSAAGGEWKGLALQAVRLAAVR